MDYKFLLRIYAPLCEGATWRSRYDELYRVYEKIDLVTATRYPGLDGQDI
jgi:hypothetical protein